MNIEEEINKIFMNILKRRVDVNERKKYTEMYQEYLDSNGNQGLSLNQIEDILYSSEEYKDKNKPKPTPKEATHDANGNILNKNTIIPVHIGSNEPIPLPVMPPIMTPKSKEIKKLNTPIIIGKTKEKQSSVKDETQSSTHKETPIIKETLSKTTQDETPITKETFLKTTQDEIDETSKEPENLKEFQEVKNEERKREELKKKQNMIKIIGERSKIHIFLSVRDNENTLKDTLNKLSEIEKMNITKYEFHYWILENDSKDNTVDIVKEFLKTKSGRIISGKLGTKKWTNVKQENRVKDMTYYRNLNLKMMFLGPMKPNANIMDINDLAVLENAVNFKNEKWKPYRSKYSIILDTNIVFEKTIFEEMETILEQNNDVGMITPFGYVRTSPMTYYDTYALQTMDNKNQANKDWIKSTNKKIIYDIKSGFSGFVLLKTDLLKKSKWKFINANLSEHVGFCESIRSQNKRVVICPAIKVGWSP